MAELIINEPTKSGFQDGYLNDVTVCYTKIQKADFKYQDKENKEYSIDLVVDEDTADAFAEMFPKNSVKKVKTADFEGRYKCEAPNPKDKAQYVLKLKASHTDYSGTVKEYDAFSRPKVYQPDAEGDLEDITMSQLIGNGSKGDVRFFITENEYGRFPHLVALCVTSLVEPPDEVGGNVGTAFGRKIKPNTPVKPKADPESQDEGTGFKGQQKPPVAAKKAAAKPPKLELSEEEEDAIPF